MTEIALTRMVDALEARDRAALEGVFAQEVALRASLPRRDVERVGAAEASGVMLGWFADCTSVKRIAFDVGTVGDVWHVSYRFALRESEVEMGSTDPKVAESAQPHGAQQ